MESPLVRLAGLYFEAQELAEELDADVMRAHLLDADWGSYDLEGLQRDRCLVLAMVGEIRAVLDELEKRVSRRAGETMPTADHAYPFGIARRQPDSSWSGWQHPDVIAAVVPRLASKEGIDIEEAQRFVAAWPAGFAWRTGALRELGIDPEEYAEHKPGRRMVRIERNRPRLEAIVAQLNDLQAVPWGPETVEPTDATERTAE